MVFRSPHAVDIFWIAVRLTEHIMGQNSIMYIFPGSIYTDFKTDLFSHEAMFEYMYTQVYHSQRTYNAMCQCKKSASRLAPPVILL